MTMTDSFAPLGATPWVPQQFDRIEGRRVSVPRPIWHLAVGWVLVIPMLYLAANGGLPGSTTDAASSSSSHTIAVALMAMMFLGVIITRKAPLLPNLLGSKLVLCLPLLAIASSAWSEQPLKSFVSGTILLFFTVFTICIASEFEFQRQVELIILVGAIALPASIILAIFAPSIGAASAGWKGIFGHKQNCAAVCTLWLITALHWKCHSFQRQLLRAIYILMCVFLIVMSGSRTGWALVAVTMVTATVLLILQRMRRQEMFLSLALVVPAVSAGAYIVHRYYALLAVSTGKDATLSQRTVIWSAVWDSILHHPLLGYGYSAFWGGLNGPSERVVLISGWDIQQAQSGYLDLWLAVGLPGVVFLACMVVISVRSCMESLRVKESRSQSRWCALIIIVALLYNIGETSFALLQMVWFLFLLGFIGLRSLTNQRASA